MGPSYQYCSQVRIWLGCDASECHLLCQDTNERRAAEERNDPSQHVRLFSRHVVEWPWFVKAEECGNVFDFERSATFENIWERHFKLIDSSWWSRMWTVQEAVLPPKAVVMYDTWSMLFEDFLGHCYKDLETHQMGCCKEAS
jgi:hypothetical protein